MRTVAIHRALQATAGAFLVGAAFMATPGLASPALAGTAGSPAQIVLVVTDASTRGSLTLTATIPPSGARSEPVHFYVATTLFGGHKLMPIGTSDGSSGSATINYRPTWAGRETFTASTLDPKSGSTVATGSYQFFVSSAEPAVSISKANPAKPLGSFGQGMVGVLLTIVLTVWVTLIVTVIRVTRGVRRLAA